MKTTIIRTLSLLCLAALVSARPVSALADEQVAASQNGKAYSGVITSVDPKEKTVTVKRFWFNETFNIGDDCTIAVGDRKSAALSDLRPGQKVEVRYQDVEGVLVAKRIGHEKLLYAGSVKAIDPDKRTLTVSRRGSTKAFSIPPDCKVVLKDDKTGSLKDVNVGHRVTVLYEAPNDALVARQIEQASEKFVGTLDAIDASTRTLKAKSLGGERKFNLADGCKIVINGKPNAELSDLRIGQRLAFSYEETDGINVVNRIAPATEAGKTETAQSKTVRRAQQ